MRTVFALLTLLVLGACPIQGSNHPGPRPIDPPDSDMCSMMCEHLAGLGCEEGKPVYNSDLPGPEGQPNQSCEDNCEELQDRGYFFNPKCVGEVTQCSQIEDYRDRDPSTCGK